MKKITESQLKDRVNRLKEYMAVVENEQYANEGIMSTIGKYAAPVGNAIVGGVQKAGQAVGNALKTTGGKVAAGLGLGATAVAAGQAMTKPAAAPATAKPAAPKK